MRTSFQQALVTDEDLCRPIHVLYDYVSSSLPNKRELMEFCKELEQRGAIDCDRTMDRQEQTDRQACRQYHK